MQLQGYFTHMTDKVNVASMIALSAWLVAAMPDKSVPWRSHAVMTLSNILLSVLGCIMLCCAMLKCAMLCCALLKRTMLCCAMP